ncbi:MAG: MmcQ/YjbR family DNA-binding protein [Acidimicrobiales bacterium]
MAKSNMGRLEKIVAQLPETHRVNVEAWDDSPTFRVRNKNFVFANDAATSLAVKLPKEEATAVVSTDEAVEPMGYGLGRHGWISFSLPLDADEERWVEVTEWIRTSYTMVAPKKLAAQVIAEDSGDG